MLTWQTFVSGEAGRKELNNAINVSSLVTGRTVVPSTDLVRKEDHVGLRSFAHTDARASVGFPNRGVWQAVELGRKYELERKHDIIHLDKRIEL